MAEPSDRQLAVFSAAFVILLGVEQGLVLGYQEPAVVAVAQQRFDASAVNQTAVAVQAALEQQPAGEQVAPAVLAGLIMVNNIVVALLIAFNHRFLLPVQSIVITSGALFMNGLIAGAMLTREVQAFGIASVLPMLPYGVLELIAFSGAGAIGYLALMRGGPSRMG